jgi:predicted DNA-binding transcriptional regulator AlpA
VAIQYLRYEDLQARKIVRNRVTLWRWIQREGFPAGILLGPHTRVWEPQTVEDWLGSRPAAGNPVKTEHTI